MLVKELIEKLKEEPQDSIVYVYDEVGFREEDIEISYDPNTNRLGIMEFIRGL